jgi:uncharacterized protein
MNLLKNYDIDISKLNLEQYDFRFQIKDEFFELFDYSLIDHGKLSADVLLDKKTSFIALNFKINGIIELICDRSLDSFDYELNIENEIVLKYGDEALEVSDEVEIIPNNIQRINVAKYLYEFISVSIPMKKLHPRYADEPAEDQIIFSSNNEEEDKSDVDPRWSELKKLKNKK